MIPLFYIVIGTSAVFCFIMLAVNGCIDIWTKTRIKNRVTFENLKFGMDWEKSGDNAGWIADGEYIGMLEKENAKLREALERIANCHILDSECNEVFEDSVHYCRGYARAALVQSEGK